MARLTHCKLKVKLTARHIVANGILSVLDRAHPIVDGFTIVTFAMANVGRDGAGAEGLERSMRYRNANSRSRGRAGLVDVFDSLSHL